jgi:hypothetical protein
MGPGSQPRTRAQLRFQCARALGEALVYLTGGGGGGGFIRIQ